jgi:hypothetical protein
MGYVGEKTLDTQTTIFDEIIWDDGDDPAGPLVIGSDFDVTGPPPGVATGLPATADEVVENRVPYWEFTHRIDAAQGLVITKAVARGTQHTGTTTLSTEEVFQRIDFTDLKVYFDDGSSAMFNVARALPSGIFQFRVRGQRTTVSPPDKLFQYGLQLRLSDNVLSGTGTCTVNLEMTVVFRGAMNDFDPGGVPVAMGCYPQLAFTWLSEGATKRVVKFRGSIRSTTDNVMSHYMHHAGAHPPPQNIAGFYTDSNTSFLYLGKSSLNLTDLLLESRATLYGVKAIGGRLMGVPASWGMLFDYLAPNVTTEKQIVGVYGPPDGNFYQAKLQRRANYVWPASATAIQYNAYVVIKEDRQGQYDNIHLHADMGRMDVEGNIQIHAPFCGHSCVHMHWRWSAIAGKGAGPRSWYYNGWSNPPGGMPAAHTTPGSPLVPPNQKVKVALCAPHATRFSEDNILNPAALGALPVRNKVIWYSSDIFAPKAGKKQVIMEHGMGWAYRYAMQNESSAVDDICSRKAFLPIFGSNPSTQEEMSDFFEEHVYPVMRYLNWVGTKINQIPDGTYDRTHVWGTITAAPPIKGEDL